MPYSKFKKLRTILDTFNLTVEQRSIFGQVPTLPISAFLQKNLQRGIEVALPNGSEKLRSEALVMPVLLEIREMNQEKISVHSGEFLDVDEARGLNGECDFLLSLSSIQIVVQTPIFTVVEAKNNEIANSMGQLVAQMLGSQIFNQRHNDSLDKIYGCVTTGDRWLFMYLENQNLCIDPKEYNILTELNKIVSILQYIVSDSSLHLNTSTVPVTEAALPLKSMA